MRRQLTLTFRFALLPLLMAGCTFNINQPNLTANTAVGDGARAVGGTTPGTSPSPGLTGNAPASPLPAGSSPAADGAPPDPPGAGERDQQALKTTLAIEASKDTRLAQTFLPARSGRLAGVGVRLATRAGRPAEATLRLHAAPDGGPSGPALGEAPVPPGDVTANRDERWVLARFPTPVAVEAGARYAWVLMVNGAFPIVVGAGDNRAYEAGESWTSSGAAIVWNRQGLDLAFRTYLAPAD